MNVTENLLTLGGRNRPGRKIIEPRAVVLHWLAAANQRPVNTRAWFEQGHVYGSAHYIIGTDGQILRVLPEDEIGYHVGTSRPDPASGRKYTAGARRLFGEDVCNRGMCNFYALGIEMSHLDMNPGTFSEATLAAAAELCADILKRYGKTADILMTHNGVVGWKDCPRLWTNRPELFDEFKARVRSLM